MNDGHAQMLAGKFDKAEAAFARALAIDEDSVAARMNLGLAKMWRDDHVAAVPILAPLVAGGPKSRPSTQILYLYGLALRTSGKAAEAVPYLLEAAKSNPREASLSFQLGVAFLDSGKLTEAKAQFEKTLEMERFHIAAWFRLAQVAQREGRSDEFDALMLKFEQNRELFGKDAFDRENKGNNRYTWPLDPPRAHQPPRTGPAAKFTRIADGDPLAVIARESVGPGVLIPIGEGGERFWYAAQKDGKRRIWKISPGSVTAQTIDIPASDPADLVKIIAGDFNNDGRIDLFECGKKASRLIEQMEPGKFAVVGQDRGVAIGGVRDATFADEDHDGDLDLWFIAQTKLSILRNAGDGTFFDDSEALDWRGLPGGIELSRVVAVEIDDDDAVDLLVGGQGAAAILLNSGQSRYAHVAAPPEITTNATGSIAAGDENNDAKIDVAIAIAENGKTRVVWNNPSQKPVEGAAGEISLVDLDGDGFLDLLTSEGRAFRNIGREGFAEATAAWGLDPLKDAAKGAADFFPRAIDLDADGDLDLLVEHDGAPIIFKNETPAGNAVAVRLVGRKSNRSGIGCRIDILAGEKRIFRQVDAPITTIPTGEIARADSVGVIWPNGATGAQFAVPAKGEIVFVEPEVALGSCPYVYVHTGTDGGDAGRFRFVTDILGNSPLGLPERRGVFTPGDTDEIIDLGAPIGTIATEDGRRVVRIEIADEMREVMYIDAVQLLVVDAPDGTETHPTDKFMPPPYPKSEVLAIARTRAPSSATTSANGDVTRELATIDDLIAAPPEAPVTQLEGVTTPHEITLDFGTIDPAAANVLALTGWIRYGDASVNIAVSQMKNLGPLFPRLFALDADGKRSEIDMVVGAPAGKTKTILVDLDGKIPAGTKKFVLANATEIYWDRILLAEKAAAPTVRSITPMTATLRFRGSAILESRGPHLPKTPIYDRLMPSLPWRTLMEGWCTKYGECTELVTSPDDRFVVANCGDIIRIEFDVTDISPPLSGLTRRWFMTTHGWAKDTDTNILTGNSVEPLPVRGQDPQIYGTEKNSNADAEWTYRWNTRRIFKEVEKR